MDRRDPSAASLEALFRQSPDAVCAARRGAVVYANPAAERLFGRDVAGERAAALFPEALRLRAEGSEEELLAELRRLSERTGSRLDWDAFLTACERASRRAGRIRSLAERLSALAPPFVDARTPQTALRSILGKETNLT